MLGLRLTTWGAITPLSAAQEVLGRMQSTQADPVPEDTPDLGGGVTVAVDLSLVPVSARPAENPALVYLSGLRPNSKRAMRAALNRVAAELVASVGEGRLRRPQISFDQIPWHQLRFQHVQALRVRLGERYSPSAANQSLVAIREVLKAAWKLGLVDGDDYRRVIDVKSVRGERLPRGRALSPAEFHALVRVCLDGSRIGQRDAALVGVLYAGGLRRAEAVGLDLDAWNPDTFELRVLGKGNKERVVYVGNGAALALRDWISIRGADPGPLFLPVTRHGRIVAKRLSTQSVFEVCRRRAEQARVPAFSPHDLRRSCASDLLDAGEDLATVQRHLGHSSPVITARYDRRSSAVLQRAAGRIHYPYVGQSP